MDSGSIYLIASSVFFGAGALIWNRSDWRNVFIKFVLAGMSLWGITIWI